MKVALFIPCYIDQFYPQVGIATLELLEKLGIEVVYPQDQTCCGQPMANSGMESSGIATAALFVEQFSGYEYIVGPSGSCVYHVRKHYDIIEQTKEVTEVRSRIIDLVEFLTDVIKVKTFDHAFPHKVGLHLSCHGQRGMRMAQSSERVAPPFSKFRDLLSGVKDIELVDLNRADECCGFGGTFAVAEAAVSTRMGLDRIANHTSQNVEVITGGDMSCLMHMEGLIRRQKQPIKVMHIAEILNGALL